MLLDIKCSAVTSIAVHLTFDDHSKKDRVIAIGDLIAVEYNANGLRKKAEGKVISISAVAADPKAWYIILDSSDDFESNKVRFSPMSILDVEIIRKADSLDVVRTPIGKEGLPYIRIVKGRLQYSIDGFEWKPIKMDSRDIIEDAEGTIPVPPRGDAPDYGNHRHEQSRPHNEERPVRHYQGDNCDDSIEDAIY